MTPPYVVSAARRLRERIRGERLFDGDDEAFKRIASRSRVYGEYGSGTSTIWMLENTSALVLSVDSSEEWTSTVRARSGHSDRLLAHWVDLGPIGRWGRPLGYSHRDRFSEYADWIWRQDERPDLVLVDGRFRVACFLTALYEADPGTYIVFDDYTSRPHYHVVEEFVSPEIRSGRQAIFTVPKLGAAKREAVANLRDAFRLVLD